MRDLLALQQPSNDRYALNEALVAHLLSWPRLAGHPLIGRLA